MKKYSVPCDSCDQPMHVQKTSRDVHTGLLMRRFECRRCGQRKTQRVADHTTEELQRQKPLTATEAGKFKRRAKAKFRSRIEEALTPTRFLSNSAVDKGFDSQYDDIIATIKTGKYI